MALVEISNPVEGTLGVLRVNAAPVAGTDEVQTLTIGGTPTGGTFKLSFNGQITAAIPWSAVNATLIASIDAALEALSNIGVGNIATTAGTVTAGIGTILLTFGGALAKHAVNTIVVADNSLIGTVPTVAVAETTPGVNATATGAGKGAVLIDTLNGKHYINTGTGTVPVWTVTGTQV